MATPEHKIDKLADPKDAREFNLRRNPFFTKEGGPAYEHECVQLERWLSELLRKS